MKKLIFDTDIGGDCDDTGALAIVHSCFEQAENMAAFSGTALTLSKDTLTVQFTDYHRVVCETHTIHLSTTKGENH